MTLIPCLWVSLSGKSEERYGKVELITARYNKLANSFQIKIKTTLYLI